VEIRGGFDLSELPPYRFRIDIKSRPLEADVITATFPPSLRDTPGPGVVPW
jgi:hypothetical protein